MVVNALIIQLRIVWLMIGGLWAHNGPGRLGRRAAYGLERSKAHPISGLGWASMHPGIRYIRLFGLYGLEV